MLHELGRYFAGARKAGMLDDSGPAGFNMVGGSASFIPLIDSSANGEA